MTDLQPGDNFFIWTISHGACTDYSADTITIYREDGPITVSDSFGTDVNSSGITFDVTLNDDYSAVNDYTLSVTQQPLSGQLIDNGNGSFTYIPDQNFVGSDVFTYEVCSVDCPDLCSSSTVQITVGAGSECVVPNIITPNGDGINDAFIVYCLADFPANELLVFNRWGDEVYRQSGYLNDWEGTFNGQTLPDGTYFYILNLNDGSGTVFQGYLVISR